MAIHIVKRGSTEEPTYDATCRTCKTQFTFNPSDAKLVHDQRDGDYFEVICPCCPTKVTVAKRRSV
jgi:hypothetical protein